MPDMLDRMWAAQQAGPTSQLSYPAFPPEAYPAPGVPSWQHLIGRPDPAPELNWPKSIDTYNWMHTDTQLGGLFRGITLPLKRFHWYVDKGGARVSDARAVADDLGLPYDKEETLKRTRNKNRFSWQLFLDHVFMGLLQGFAYFEQIGEYDGTRWRLRKLAYIEPDTINQFIVESDGGLLGIRQFGFDAPIIPMDRMVAAVWGKIGSSWVGRSIFRELYGSWFIKDQLLRTDLVKHIRNGMGVPIIECTQPNPSPKDMLMAAQLTEQYRAGNASGGALPYGMRLRLVGTEGSIPDTLASIRYHDELQARNLMLMVLQLGQTHTGSRALGSTFQDLMTLGLVAFAEWIAETVNLHIVEDWFDINVGPNSEVAIVKFDVVEDPQLQLKDLKDMIDSGMVVVDPTLRGWFRQRYRMPDMDDPNAKPDPKTVLLPSGSPGNDPAGTTPPTPAAPPKPPAGAPTTAPKAAVPPGAMFRRERTDNEIKAAADFPDLQSTIDSIVTNLVAAWKSHAIPDLNATVLAEITAAKSLDKLAKLPVPTIDHTIILDHIKMAEEKGRASALHEAFAQGNQIADPGQAVALVEARAKGVASMLSKGYVEAASRKAIQLSPDGKGSASLAGRVADHLAGLSDSYLSDQMNGAAMAALNNGRSRVFQRSAQAPEDIVASELMDSSTCANCRAIDGKRYATLAEADSDYPTGGYFECLGGVKCRGLVLVVWKTSEGI